MSNYNFNKKFADGNQNIHVDESTHTIVENEFYDWSKRAIYNKIGLFVTLFKELQLGLDSEKEKEILYGKNGLVEQLIPLQIDYNSAMNCRAEYIDRISKGNIIAEEGSINEEKAIKEGLAPGKVITYKLGSESPEMGKIDSNLIYSLNECIKDLERQMQETYDIFIHRFKVDYIPGRN